MQQLSLRHLAGMGPYILLYSITRKAHKAHTQTQEQWCIVKIEGSRIENNCALKFNSLQL